MTLRDSVGLGHTQHASPEQLLTAAGQGALRLVLRSVVQNTGNTRIAFMVPSRCIYFAIIM